MCSAAEVVQQLRGVVVTGAPAQAVACEPAWRRVWASPATDGTQGGVRKRGEGDGGGGGG